MIRTVELLNTNAMPLTFYINWFCKC